MTTLFNILKSLFKDEGIKVMPKRNPSKLVTDPVYDFFVKETSATRKRVYDKALKAADADQKAIIHEYETRQKDLISA